MATYGNQDYTSFRAVNLRGSTQLRISADNAAGTIKADLSEGLDRAWTLPNKSGTLPIMGTFSVQLAAAVGAEFNTIVTVSGIRAEDALVVQLNKHNSAAYGFENSTGYILVASEPRNGQIALFFNNLGNATGYIDVWGSYIATR